MMIRGPVPADRRPPLRWRAIVGAAVLPMVGLVVYSALADSPDVGQGLATAALFVGMSSPILVGVGVLGLAGVARLLNVRRGRRRSLWLTGPAAALALAMTVGGLYEHAPAGRFRRYAGGPPPPSIADLHLRMADSFSDGSAWVFAFRLAPADFPPFADRLGLHEVSPPAAADPSPADRLLSRDGNGLYARPTAGHFFVGNDRTVFVVTSASYDHVWLYRNFWVDPSGR